MIEHQVWAIPPGKRKRVLFMAFDADRWQWAEKLLAYLQDQEFRGVEMRDVDESEQEKDG